MSVASKARYSKKFFHNSYCWGVARALEVVIRTIKTVGMSDAEAMAFLKALSYETKKRCVKKDFDKPFIDSSVNKTLLALSKETLSE
ncbi:MAG: hypothetical protein ABSA16_13445 [Thermoguttaceae bacterium]|jgi:uncharacterized phosphosugar-binding protein